MNSLLVSLCNSEIRRWRDWLWALLLGKSTDLLEGWVLGITSQLEHGHL